MGRFLTSEVSAVSAAGGGGVSTGGGRVATGGGVEHPGSWGTASLGRAISFIVPSPIGGGVSES